MALSERFIDAHVARWRAEFHQRAYPYREHWPSRLFHHSPLENAVQILQRGVLRSRKEAAGRAKDVAAGAVINTRMDAHDSVRFYFRPRTPTQYHIEGIKRPTELPFGENAHAPVLIMFVFDAKRILLSEGVRFCDRNMQLSNANPSDTEDYFSAIPFDKVYHEGGWGADATIKDHRCAEVLALSPVDLSDNLQWIYCRSEAERATLIYKLGPLARRWEQKIRVSDDLKVFQKEGAYIEIVGLTQEGVIFRMNPRRDRQPLDVEMEVWESDQRVVHKHYSKLLAAPEHATNWIEKTPFSNGSYRVLMRVDGQLAYEAQLTIGDSLF